MTNPQFEVAKGNRDWYGVNAVLRGEVATTLKNIFERYGYEPIETPIIETQEVIAFKGGGEIQKEVFKLTDQGARKLALRFDQTLPLARFVATHADIKFPFKRYVIGPVFRDGPTQPDQGRYRQFTQCDVDVLGVKEMSAEAELFSLAQDSFDALGLGGVEVRINNRKLLDGILDVAKVPPEAKLRTIVTLDKLDKIGWSGVQSSLESLTFSDESRSVSNETLLEISRSYEREEKDVLSRLRSDLISQVGEQGYRDFESLSTQGLDQSDLISKIAAYSTKGARLLNTDMIAKLMALVQLDGNNDEVYDKLNDAITEDRGREGLAEIKQLIDYSRALGFDFVRFDPSLARGLDYYTGTTIEVYLKDRSVVNSAILAGGRFDNMIGEFRGEETPAVGFSFGLERLVMALRSKRPDIPKTRTQLYLIPVGNVVDHCLKIAHVLRKAGVNLDMDFLGRRVGKAIAYADARGIPYVGIVGEDELRAGTMRVKHLSRARQETMPFANVSSYICQSGTSAP